MTQKELNTLLDKILFLKTDLSERRNNLNNLVFNRDISLMNTSFDFLMKYINDLNLCRKHIETCLNNNETLTKIVSKTKKNQKLYSSFDILDEELFSHELVELYYNLYNEAVKKDLEAKEFNATLGYGERDKRNRFVFNLNLLEDKLKRYLLSKYRVTRKENVEENTLSEKNIVNLLRHNAFNKNGYCVNVSLSYYQSQLDHFCNYSEFDNFFLVQDLFKNDIIPNFQRDNNKWNENMQISFIENVLKGYKTKIQLYRITNREDEGEFVLDGQQRLNALNRFLQSEIRVFKELDEQGIGFTYDEIATWDSLKVLRRSIDRCDNLIIERFEFDTLEEVILFYIDMNEGITHSNEDILKAKLYLKNISSEDIK